MIVCVRNGANTLRHLKKGQGTKMNLPVGYATISCMAAAKLLREAKGMVSVYVIKRTDGTLRRFNGFLAEKLTPATRGRMLADGTLTGAGQAFEPAAHNLIPFYEMVSDFGGTGRGRPRRTIGKQFRHVALEGIRAVRCGGRTYNVEPLGLT